MPQYFCTAFDWKNFKSEKYKQPQKMGLLNSSDYSSEFAKNIFLHGLKNQNLLKAIADFTFNLP